MKPLSALPKRKLKARTSLVIVVFAVSLVYSVQFFIDNSYGINAKRVTNSSVKVLVWTETSGKTVIHFLPKKLTIETTECSKAILCPKTRLTCNFTLDKRLIGEADAVWFEGNELNADIENIRAGKPFDIFPVGKRREDQAWIFYGLESPSNNVNSFRSFPNIFNWTMTYRSDSDIPFPYGKIKKRLVKRKPSEIFNNQYYSNRSKLVAWTVSNCWPKSNRTQIAKELAEFVPVDIYGKCGNYTCPRESTFGSHGCHKYQEKIYKFYLAFENSLCDEYVTEKFFNTLKSDMIPIVYGLADYASIAPPRSFINVKDFKSVQKLADYLLWLDRNPQEYAKYFEWKKYFDVVDFVDMNMNVWCDLCEKVAKERDAGWPLKKSWGDLRYWYFNEIPRIVSKDSQMKNQALGFTKPVAACT